MLDLRQLHYFVVVAEEEHVGRAADRLHISQSPLSRQIAQLEQRLGLMLFERSAQRIRLTADGRTFLHEARALLTHARRLESLGNRLGRGDEGGLCLGYTEHAMHSGVLPNGLRVLRAGRPQLHVALYNMHSAGQIEGLRQRSLDLALLPEPPSPDDPDLLCARVLDDPMLLALPEAHPLAARKTLDAADLAALDWIAVRHQDSMAGRDAFVAACALAGFTPSITMEATEPLTALGLVAAGLGAATIARSLRRQAPAGVALLELPGFGYRTPLWLAWHRINLRPLVAIFRETLLRLAHDPAPATPPIPAIPAISATSA